MLFSYHPKRFNTKGGYTTPPPPTEGALVIFQVSIKENISDIFNNAKMRLKLFVFTGNILNIE